MKKMILGFIVTSMLAIAVPAIAFADTFAQDLISDMQTKHEELKAQVDAGELTKEEALDTWYGLLDEARADIQSHFDDRMVKAQERLHNLEAIDPEKAAELQARFDIVTGRRAQMLAERNRIVEQLMNGEITRVEAQQMRITIRQQQLDNIADVRQTMQDRRETRRSNR
ncbi:hypothetical protein KKC94_05345 [Patescibacteria group bacterium]|nr:hypothetical protein [Patescibacteria group bacterium]